jgi:hypothetical protein
MSGGGEELLHFVETTEHDPEFAQGLPYFVAQVKRRFTLANGRSYPATPNIILSKPEKSGFTKTRTHAWCTAIFSQRNVFARKVKPQFCNGIGSRVLFVSTTSTARNLLASSGWHWR